MITSIIYSSNLLDGILGKEDIEFLKNSNSKQDEIEFAIEMSNFKKDEISKYLKSLETDNSSDTVPSFEDSFNIASTASKSISATIKNLNSMFNSFNDIEKDVLELAVKKDTIAEEDKTSSILSITSKIVNFKNTKDQLEAENKSYNLDIDKFFTDLENGNLLKPKKNTEEENTLKVFNVYDSDFKDNLELKISEKDKKVYLPYTKQDLQDFMTDYPNEYPSAKSVVEKEFTEKISMYNNHPTLARFREGYYLSKYKESNSTISSLKFAKSIMFRRDLNPTIVAAVRSKQELEDYIDCLENNALEEFNHFKITFES